MSLATAVAVASTLVLAGCDDYGKLMRKKLQSVLGTSPLWAGTRYVWFQYPTNNFGVGTTFILTAKEPTPNENTQRCSTYSCFGIETPKTPDGLRSAGGFADFGVGGVITLTEKEVKSLSVSAVLPKVYEVLNVDVGASVKATTTTKLSLGPACVRVLDKVRYEKVLASLGDDPRKEAFAAGQLGVVVADVMIQSMAITISVNKESAADLGASLDGKVGAVLGKDAKLKVGVSKNVDGTYTLTCDDPVIVAALIKKQSAGNRLSSAKAEAKGLAQWDGAIDTLLEAPAAPR